MNERFCADKTVIRTLSHVRFKGHSGETDGRGRGTNHFGLIR